jgi:hypothetical protein
VVSFLGGLFAFDFISFMPIGCMTATTFYNTLLVYTGFPIVMTLILVIAYFAVSSQTLKNALFEAGKEMQWIKFNTSTLLWAHLSHMHLL